MKKITLLLTVGFLSTSLYATDVPKEVKKETTGVFTAMTPTYLDGVFQGGGWNSNWFISVQGGVSAFAGKPIGCGDFFDRTKFALNASLGKWFTPRVGARLAFQGFKMKDALLSSVSYQSFHADLLYNVASHFRTDLDELPRWDFIPYLGLGLIHNNYVNSKPFAFSYGFITNYRITPRLRLTAELSGTTTSRDFDGYFDNTQLGDNLFQLTAGLTVTIGKSGWKKVVDPKPYIYQNDLLLYNNRQQSQLNELLEKQHTIDVKAIEELKKVLEIEGLLGKYELLYANDQTVAEEESVGPKNNYSGLNSLRARMGELNKEIKYIYANSHTGDSLLIAENEYLKDITEGTACIGVPVYFFFKVNTAKFTEKSQEVNIQEIANVMKKYHLHAQVIGAADSRTGVEKFNMKLSQKRADFVADLLRKAEVPDDLITTEHQGGVEKYTPYERNRNTCIFLYLK